MDKKHHIQCGIGDVGGYVFLPGDPGRVESLAQYFEAPERVANNREYLTYSGYLMGERVSVVSTGIGCPSTAIAVEELSDLGVHTFVRVGGGGSLQDYVKIGDMVIPTGAIRDEGTSQQIIPLAYPAVADYTVIRHLKEAGDELGFRCHLGIVHSKDSLSSEIVPESLPNRKFLEAQWHAWLAGRTLASEMEVSVIYILAAIKGLRAGAVIKVRDEKYDPTKGFSMGMDDCNHLAVRGMERLIAADKQQT